MLLSLLFLLLSVTLSSQDLKATSQDSKPEAKTESSCVIVKRMGPADEITSRLYSFGIRGKQFQYIEGTLPNGIKFHGRLTDNDVRQILAISIPPGKHVVTVKKNGFQDWVRKVNVYGGSITLNAELTHGIDEPHPANSPAAPDSRKEPATTAVSTDSSPKPIGWIGVHAQNSGDVAVVTNVSADGPGAKAGIQVGDIILALDGRLIKGKDFETVIAVLKPGTQISVNYARGSSAHEVWVTVGSRN